MHKKFYNEQGQHINDQEQYAFLFDKSHPKYIGRPLSFLTVGGSIAYGMDVETSDVDLRGIAFSLPEEIIGNVEWEGAPNKKYKMPEGVDVAIHSYAKLFKLLTKCNPNVLEILCTKDEHVLYMDEIAEMVRDNVSIFLSKHQLHGAFAGFSNAQLRRMRNKSSVDATQEELEESLLASMENLQRTMNDRYAKCLTENVKLSLIDSMKAKLDTEVGITMNLVDCPIRDMKGLFSELAEVINNNEKVGNRNEKVSPEALSKHIAHTFRPFFIEIEAHETGVVTVFQEKHIPELMEIRAGKYVDENGNILPEMYSDLDALVARVKVAYDNSVLPDKPDFKAIQKLLMKVQRIMLDKLDDELMI